MNNKELKCYLPIAFINNDKYQYNNIGLVWIIFSPNKIKNYKELKIYLENRKYEAIVSNFFLNTKFVSNDISKSTREKVDVVISMTYAINPVENVTWSYYNAPDYPVYVGIGTMKNNESDILKTRVTFTINTELFFPYENLQQIDIYNNRLTE